MFDCVMPTRNGRNGQLFTTQGIINIKNAQWTDDHSPINPGLGAYVARTFTKAYVRHLLRSREYLDLPIVSQQNLAFSCWLMDEVQPRVSRRL